MTVDPSQERGEPITATVTDPANPVQATPSGDAAVPAPPSVTPSAPARQINWLPVLVFGGIIAAIAAGGGWLLWTIGSHIGVEAFIIGVIASMLPVPLLVLALLWLDRYEPEPPARLLFCFIWGALGATTIAYLVNTFFSVTVGWPDSVVGTVVAPVIEESMKALGPIVLVVGTAIFHKRRALDGVIDGIVYCGMSATGFAMTENIIYLGGRGFGDANQNLGAAMGIQTLLVLFVVRILMSGFAHPLFTAMTGIGLGLAARSRSSAAKVLFPVGGLLLAMTLHGTWNLFPTLVATTGSSLYFLYGYLGFEVPLFFGLVGFVFWLRSWENRVVARNLHDYVRAGWFSPPEIASLLTVDRRLAAQHWARQVAGEPGRRAMKAYQTAATRLGLLRDSIRRGLSDRPADAHRAIADETQLLADLQSYRAVFTGRDRRVPAAYWDGGQYHLAFPDGVVRMVPAPPDPVVPTPVVLAPPPVYPPQVYPPPGYGAYPGYPPPRPS